MRPPAFVNDRNKEIAGSRFLMAKSAMCFEPSSKMGDESTARAFKPPPAPTLSAVSKSSGLRTSRTSTSIASTCAAALAANARSSLLKQLEPLPGQAGKIKEQPGKISARPAKTAHESALNRIGFQIECHNRDRSGGVPRGPNRWGTDRIDNVGVK